MCEETLLLTVAVNKLIGEICDLYIFTFVHSFSCSFYGKTFDFFPTFKLKRLLLQQKHRLQHHF